MAEAIGLVDAAITRAQQLYERYKKMKSNRGLCGKLKEDFVKVKEKLRKLQNSTVTEATPEGFTNKLNKLISPSEDMGIFQNSAALRLMPDRWINNLNELIFFFSQANDTLETLWSKSEKNVKGFKRASKTREKLQELLDDFRMLESRAWLLDNFGTIIEQMKNDFGRTRQEIKNLGEKVENLQARPGNRHVEFVPTFHVPQNPSGVLVNFSDPDTMESALKRKVLDESSTVVGAVGAKGASAVIATGMGGVGKTSALRAIGADREVQDHYNGGVYFFTLGQNATSAEVISMVAAAVQRTGGVKEAKEINNEQNVRSGMSKAVAWFADKRCLFICDDLWRTESRPSSYLYDLKALVPSGSRSCLLFSTRDLKIAEEIDIKNQVHFSTRSDNEAAAILRGYAGFQENETYSNESFQFVLKLCCGLPVALAVAGRSVQRIARTSQERRLAWDVYKERFQEAGGETLCTEAAGDHEGLFHTLTASLEEASKLGEFRNMAHGKRIQVIHRAFCVLRKQTWAPSSMLACLWGVEERKAEKIAEEMELLSLLSIERRKLDQKSVLGVTLHDLVHDFCKKRAQENKEVAMWHARLLDGYICRSKLSKENFEGGFETHKWWSVRLADDKYLHTHLTYHLAEGRRQEELESIMLDFRWTYRQLKVNGFLTLKDDFQLFNISQRSRKPETVSEHSQGPYRHDEESNDKRSSCNASSQDNKGDLHSANVADQIELIVGALRLSWSLLVSQKSKFTQRELAFQMMGRLCSLRSKPVVDKYLRSVEREAERPWAKPVGPCLELPGGPTYGKFRTPGPVHAVSVIHAMGFAVAGDDKGNLSILNMKSMGTVRNWRGHEGGVISVAVSGDGRRIVSGSEDETVSVWDTETGEALGVPLRGHGNWVTSVAVSGDGQRIVSGSEDKTVRIWDMETGEAVGEPLRGHGSAVSSVALSEDGQWIVSGSCDGTVRIWNMETGEPLGEPLRGHESAVSSVAVSGDGQKIVSGSYDTTVRIWNIETGEAIGEPLRGHTNEVMSVAVSGDGRRIVSGSYDTTVRIWNMLTGEALGEPLRGHQGVVMSVAVSRDGRQIVSGSYDRTVRIWNMEMGKALKEPTTGHRGPVTSVAVSGDGRQIVSGSYDTTVRMWNMETGEALGEPLRAHGGVVMSVAVSGDGQRIVSGLSDGTVRIWNLGTGEALRKPLRGYRGSFTSLEVSEDGQWTVSGPADVTVRISDMETGEPVREPLRGHECTVTSVAVSGDGRRMVSGSYYGTVRIWDMETGEPLGEPLHAHGGPVRSVAVSGDGQRIVSGLSDGTVRIWNMETGEALGEPLRAHGGPVSSVAVSGDGQRIVSGSWDWTVRIWDMETGEAIGVPLERDEYSVASVSRSGLLDEFTRMAPGNDGARGEMLSAPILTTRTFCITGHDGIFYGDIAKGTDAMKIGSFESEVNAWLLDTEGKVWAGLANGTLAVVRTMK